MVYTFMEFLTFRDTNHFIYNKGRMHEGKYIEWKKKEKREEDFIILYINLMLALYILKYNKLKIEDIKIHEEVQICKY